MDARLATILEGRCIFSTLVAVVVLVLLRILGAGGVVDDDDAVLLGRWLFTGGFGALRGFSKGSIGSFNDDPGGFVSRAGEEPWFNDDRCGRGEDTCG